MSTPAMVALETTNRAKALGGNLSGMQAPILVGRGFPVFGGEASDEARKARSHRRHHGRCDEPIVTFRSDYNRVAATHLPPPVIERPTRSVTPACCVRWQE
jgi:hypothetical protein